MGSNGSRVTICLPAYNAERFIERTIDSVLAQTERDFRLIIGVDKSTDQTEEICRRYSESDDQISLVVHQESKGWIGNSNSISEMVETEYMLLLSHDDELLPNCIEASLAAIEKDLDLVAVYSDIDCDSNESNHKWLLRYDQIDHCKPGFETAKMIATVAGPFYVIHHALVCTDVARSMGFLRKHLGGEFLAGWSWAFGLACSGRIQRVPEVLSL